MARGPIHPGKQLAEHMAAVGMSAAELGRQIKVPSNRISEIVKGARNITGDTALRLGHFFGNSAEFWMNLQSSYELQVAEERLGRVIATLPTLSRLKRKAHLTTRTA